MPATFSVVRGAFTPSLTHDNYLLIFNASTIGMICRIGWGGRMLQPTPYRTRWVVPSTGAVIGSSPLTIQLSNPAVGTSTIAYASAGTPAVLPADPANIFATDWNAQGGEGVLNFPYSRRPIIWQSAGGSALGQFCCRNTQGVDANGSYYSVTWEE